MSSSRASWPRARTRTPHSCDASWRRAIRSSTSAVSASSSMPGTQRRQPCASRMKFSARCQPTNGPCCCSATPHCGPASPSISRPISIADPTFGPAVELGAQRDFLRALVDDATLWVAEPDGQLPPTLRTALHLAIQAGIGEEMTDLVGTHWSEPLSAALNVLGYQRDASDGSVSFRPRPEEPAQSETLACHARASRPGFALLGTGHGIGRASGRDTDKPCGSRGRRRAQGEEERRRRPARRHRHDRPGEGRDSPGGRGATWRWTVRMFSSPGRSSGPAVGTSAGWRFATS